MLGYVLVRVFGPISSPRSKQRPGSAASTTGERITVLGQNQKSNGTKNLAKSLKEVATTVADVAETLDLDAQRRKEREAKYPECTRLSRASSQRHALAEFLEWLREKNITLCSPYDGDEFQPSQG